MVGSGQAPRVGRGRRIHPRSGGDFEPDDSVDWTHVYGIDKTGAVLVRPDGHVCFRAAELNNEHPYKILDSAFTGLGLR
ncbi:hypothetical protein E0T84_20945 [Mycobacterium sp. DBP42]|nr:hypothetical protein E0T84_20945 [Mycobacterium sp. DBP42]